MHNESAILERVCMEAAAWCSLASPHDRLRTPRLKPALPRWPTAGALEAAVHALVTARRELLSGRTAADVRGRLLVCNVNESISSGESEAETNGFFDVNDRPAWDTWIGSAPRQADDSEPTLISWVPSELVGSVGRGIDVNPYECIFWLADARALLAEWPVARALVAAGLG